MMMTQHISLSPWEREGARRVSGGKGEGDVCLSPSPFRRKSASLPLPMGEGL